MSASSGLNKQSKRNGKGKGKGKSHMMCDNWQKLNNTHNNGVRLGQALFKVVSHLNIAHKYAQYDYWFLHWSSTSFRLGMSLVIMH
jgi:hypothetical protein